MPHRLLDHPWSVRPDEERGGKVLRRAEGYTPTHFPPTSRLAPTAVSAEDCPVSLVAMVSGVNYSLLRSWLGLAPGPWPPDHYALLGLAPGPCDPAAVENVVLARMDLLRPHQLLHPELVTEGMNRLAQALICLTDPAARAAYDAELGLPRLLVPPESQKPVAAIPETTEVLTFEPTPGFPIPADDPEPNGTDVTQVIDMRYEPGLEPPEPLPPAYEVVENEAPEPLPPAYEVIWETEGATSGTAYEVVEAKVVSPPPEPPWQPPTRRALFARLAAVRRLLVAWQKLKSLLGDPREPIDRPVRVLALLEAVAEVHPLLDSVPGVVGKLSQPGGLVALLLRQPLVLHTIRALLPDQRRAVATDWQRAELELTRETVRLRELARSGRPLLSRSRARSRLRRLVRWVTRTPEAILLALAVAIVIVAILRGYSGR